MKVSVILPAAGLGLRLKSKVAKPLISIDGVPIVVHTLKKIDSCSLISEIIVAFNPQGIAEMRDLIDKNSIKKVSSVVSGGATRKESVGNALKHISPDSEIVLIHDGVRPFIDHGIISRAIEAASKNGAAAVGVPVKATLKKLKLGTREVDSTLNREEIWEIQTPQAFKKEIILEAYEKSDDAGACDDSLLVERLGYRVVLVEGSYLNIKITTPEDLVLAQAIIKDKK